jgi:hypothetical protein
VEYLELALFWHTKGKGTQDIGIAETLRFDNPALEEERLFNMPLPAGPYSFSSKLISIVWSLELTDPDGKSAYQKDFVLSPTQQEIVCTENHHSQPSQESHEGYTKNYESL